MKILVNVTTFEKILESLVTNLNNDPETQKYGQYIGTYYANRPKQWAHCYRKQFRKNTNMSLEKWHHEIKHNSRMNGKCQRRLDVGINNVMECLRMKFLKRLVSISRNRVPFKLSELRRRHKLAEGFLNDIDIVEEVPNLKWFISSFKNKSNKTLLEYYEVKLENEEKCNCVFFCNDCKSCLHTYSCTCHDFAIQYNMCKHIHIICLKYPRTSTIDENLQLLSSGDLNNNASDLEHNTISGHLQGLAEVKNLDLATENVLQELDNLKKLVVLNGTNSEVISYVKKNVLTVTRGIHAIIKSSNTVDTPSKLISSCSDPHNKKIEHQNRRLPSLHKLKKKTKAKEIPKETETTVCNLVLG
ncbi:unnamed protein product [Psylliodes chrysocephalus]|uniref:SWIM-type domain-containing protein n=1 Tax=Psylliodes chrysocephalus TaxID=3402493 RepID=A0A9P0D1F4_9CUCU|nr:unnamed protein product [Psylliodes chrysocephala]